MKKRNYTIDILKGLAIILVVYCHITRGVFAYDWIRSFHMPLFSFASGFLTCGRTDLPFGKYFFKKGRALFIPYTVFFAITLACAEIYYRHYFGHFLMPDLLWLKGYLFTGKHLLSISHAFGEFPFVILWFFQTTFFAYILFWFVSKFKGWAFVASTIVLGLISWWLQVIYGTMIWSTPFNFKIIPLFAFYMCFGAIFKTYLIGKVPKERKPLLSISLLLLGICLVNITDFHGSIRLWGTPMYIPMSLVTVTGWYGFFSVFKRCTLLEYLGRHSLYIYGLHRVYMYPIQLACRNVNENFFDNMPAQLSLVVVTIALCCLSFEAYERIKFKLVGR